MLTLQTEPEIPKLAGPIEPSRVPALGDEELDALPFGALCLDAAGKVLRYNLAEARMARLDRAQVLGRPFFGVVAPCTANPEFEGRVRAFLRDEPGAANRFDFIFDFKFGAQQVEVELVRDPLPDRVWLCINRRRFLTARSGPEARTPAPLQSDLAPGERQLGVLRDDGARRRVLVSGPFFEAMRHTWQRVAPRGWPLFCNSWGVKWGRLAAVDLEAESLEASGRSLREVPMRQAVEQMAAYVGRQGWGRLQVDFSHARTGAILLTLERNALAESVGPQEGPACHLLSGFFRALFSHLAGRILAAGEVRCACQVPQQPCAFLVVAQHRQAELDAAAAAAQGDLEAALRAFQAPAGKGGT